MLILENDVAAGPSTFARDLTSLLQTPEAPEIQGLAVGRFQQESGVTRELLRATVDRQPVLAGLPVLANVDFGHTQPQMTLPIGGLATLKLESTNILQITER